jgi:hypothetical protein
MFSVVWQPSATDQFAAICVAQPGRWSDINDADNDITAKLEHDPLKFSQAVSEGLRRIISGPLVVYFSIDGNQVTVESVGWIG